jgi:hypothetical protein
MKIRCRRTDIISLRRAESRIGLLAEPRLYA